VPEYWRFDDTGGEYYSTHLAGDRLVNGTYEPIGVNEVGNAMHWGYSEVLGLYLCWEYGYLHWYDPAGQGYLETYDQEADSRIAAEARARQLEGESAIERDGRLAAEERNRELEAEIRRLQNQ
jgi:hypothetical protein